MLKPFPIFIVLAALFAIHLSACGNSEYPEASGWDDIIETWVSEENDQDDDTSHYSQSSSSKEFQYLPIDDSKYPYAGIPRIVIVTENYRKIKDRETEIPAKLQIWGKKAPDSEIMDLTIKGRGNSSWYAMPKNSYKIEFVNKQEMLGMPKNRDWALIANYADKTLMKNYLMYNLSAKLGAYYTPRCEFVELYLNKEYLGVYLLTETIKIGKNRINIPQTSNSFIVEIDVIHLHEGQQAVYSDIIDPVEDNEKGTPFHILSPKNASEQDLSTVKEHIRSFEKFLVQKSDSVKNFKKWIDVNEYIKHYWIQEFSKNPDANFRTSVFFSWVKDDIIKMGPVWDFDLAIGGYPDTAKASPTGWYIKRFYWNKYIFKDSVMKSKVKTFWEKNRNIFYDTNLLIDSTAAFLQRAADNNFKRWKVLQSTENRYHTKSFKDYNEAINNTKKWFNKRFNWIDNQLKD